jgi:hypothetical protein
VILFPLGRSRIILPLNFSGVLTVRSSRSLAINLAFSNSTYFMSVNVLFARNSILSVYRLTTPKE